MKERAEIIIRASHELGIPLYPSSRLGRQIAFYVDRKKVSPQFIEPDHPLHNTGVEAYRDLNQIAFAPVQLQTVVPTEELKRRLRKLDEDNVLPQNSPERSPGRRARPHAGQPHPSMAADEGLAHGAMCRVDGSMSVERANDGNNAARHAMVQIATYQTLGVDREDGDESFLAEHHSPDHFSHIVIDECHRSA